MEGGQVVAEQQNPHCEESCLDSGSCLASSTAASAQSCHDHEVLLSLAHSGHPQMCSADPHHPHMLAADLQHPQMPLAGAHHPETPLADLHHPQMAVALAHRSWSCPGPLAAGTLLASADG